MLLFSVTVLLATAAAFDVIKVSIYNIADLQSWEIDIACSENCFELKNVLPHNLRLLLEQLTQSTYITYYVGATVIVGCGPTLSQMLFNYYIPQVVCS